MCKIVAITNRKLVVGDFLQKIEQIASSSVSAIILREKDLSESEYKRIAKEVLAICKSTHTQCILHHFVDVACELKCDSIHLPLSELEALDEGKKSAFKVIGASIHSLEEARLAQREGATYITASHIFATDCKKGVEPRGLEFLQEVCNSVDIEVWALGGIADDNIQDCIKYGASAVCMMSNFMR